MNWRGQWATPLLWANKMANDLNNLNGDAKIKDIKEGITTTLRRFSSALEALHEHYEHRIPYAFFRILRIAIYAFMIVSAIGNQDMALIASEEHSPFMEIILDCLGPVAVISIADDSIGVTLANYVSLDEVLSSSQGPRKGGQLVGVQS